MNTRTWNRIASAAALILGLVATPATLAQPAGYVVGDVCDNCPMLEGFPAGLVGWWPGDWNQIPPLRPGVRENLGVLS